MGDRGIGVADAMITVYRTHALDATVDELRGFFRNDHVHMALIVDEGGRLVTTIERSDLGEDVPGDLPAKRLGTLRGRTTPACTPLEQVAERFGRDGRRRLAVIDDDGRLVGLLCRKRSGRGYCTDEGVRAREHERDVHRATGSPDVAGHATPHRPPGT
jgi:CBS-domain-containing membrane protein